MAENEFVIGWCMPQKNLARYLSPSFLEQSHSFGFHHITLDPNEPIPLVEPESGRPLTCILHKVLDNPAWAQSLEDLHRSHPSICIIDPLPSCLPLTSRASMLDSVRIPFDLPSSSSSTTYRVRAPREVTLPISCPLSDALSRLQSSSMAYPLLVKPVESCGADTAHVLAVVQSDSALDRILRGLAGGMTTQSGWIVQEYIPHSKGVVKAYVVGSECRAVLKASIPPPSSPSAPTNPTDDSAAPRVFSAVSKADTVAGTKKKEATEKDDAPSTAPHAVHPSQAEADAAAVLPQDVCAAVCRELARRLQLRIFNVDILVREGGRGEEGGLQELVVVDINFFPGIDKLPGWEGMLLRALQEWIPDARAPYTERPDHVPAAADVEPAA